MAFNPPLGSTNSDVFMGNVQRLDELVNGPAADVPDRAGDPLYSWRLIRQSLIPLSRQYMTLADAQADIANIPDGSSTYVRSTDGSSLADEYINNGGTLEATGRKMPSAVPTGYQAATAVSSSADNTIDLTIPGLLVDGALVYFLSPILNTGAVTVSISNSGETPAIRPVQKQANSPLTGGELLVNQPVLMEYRTGTANNFVLVASGPVASELVNRTSALELNSILVITGVTSAADSYSGVVSNIPGIVASDRVFLFTPNATSTTQTPKLSVNGGVARAIKSASGGGLVVGDLVAGYPYLLKFNFASADFRLLTTPNDRTRVFNAYAKGIVTSDASSPNAISVTIPGGLGDGTQITFEPTATNTGSATLVITDVYGNTATRNLVKGSNQALTGGELLANQPATVQWRGAPQNNFKLLYSGDPTTAIQNLSKDIAVLKSSLTDPYAALSDKLVGTGDTAVQFPFGKISWSAGVKTVTKQRIICTSIGSSVGTGAGSGDNAKYAPNALFVAALQNELANYGEFEIIDDNQCIPTQAFQQFSAQLDNSPYATSDFVLIVGGMNDAPVGNFNIGLTFPRQKTTLEALIDKCLARGAIPIVCTSPHHNVEMPQTAPTIPGGNPLFWPFRTYSVVSTYVFDATANTIMNDYFASPVYGGDILSPGHSLRVDSGDNMGVYTITAISTDRTTITVQEPIPVSGSIPTTVRHFNLQSIAEDILYPPPSQSVVSKDWSGNGIITQGDVRFEMMNNIQRSSARKKGAFIAECELSFFEYGVEVGGYSSVFNVPAGNYNHLSANGYTVSYGYPLTAAARKLARLIYGEKNYTA
ncbi:hypothetical protein [Klebsiella aerogenes]|uniref:hypothetical protein n=1 Tax=Klebsiella aerogenes TaxID=548 RepID=UPI002FF5BF95